MVARDDIPIGCNSRPVLGPAPTPSLMSWTSSLLRPVWLIGFAPPLDSSLVSNRVSGLNDATASRRNRRDQRGHLWERNRVQCKPRPELLGPSWGETRQVAFHRKAVEGPRPGEARGLPPEYQEGQCTPAASQPRKSTWLHPPSSRWDRSGCTVP
jgi:hypothetical protein